MIDKAMKENRRLGRRLTYEEQNAAEAAFPASRSILIGRVMPGWSTVGLLTPCGDTPSTANLKPARFCTLDHSNKEVTTDL